MRCRPYAIAMLFAVSPMLPPAARAADFAAPVTANPPVSAVGGAHHAAEIARIQTGGRVLDVRPAFDHAQSAYEVRVLLDAGRVRRVVVDVASGKVQ